MPAKQGVPPKFAQFHPFLPFFSRNKNPNQTLKQKSNQKQTPTKMRGIEQK
jgi:hypothetical protein